MNLVKSTAISIALSLLIALFLTPSSINAFNGDRKGFVAGLGLGVAPVVNWSNSFHNINETELGFAVNFIIGHGFSPKNLVVWNLSGAGGAELNSSNKLIVQSLNGVQWYHFLSDKMRSLYTSVGIGSVAFSEERFANERGIGFRIEIGYVAEKNLLIGMYSIIGRTSRAGHSTSHKQLGFHLTLLGY